MDARMENKTWKYIQENGGGLLEKYVYLDWLNTLSDEDLSNMKKLDRVAIIKVLEKHINEIIAILNKIKTNSK